MASIEGQTLGHARARQLLRRSGFGAKPSEVAAYETMEAGAAVDQLLDFEASSYKPIGGGRDFSAAQRKQHDNWVKFMLKQKPPEALREKLVLFWHDHFATGISKVFFTRSMAAQNKLLRERCAGDMKALVKAINVDPAMIEWLDTVRNFKAIPNENYARELQELFTLGVLDIAGNPTYTQDDVVQIARAFTGHTYDRSSGKHAFDFSQHDTTSEFGSRGPKVIFQSTGGFGGGGKNYLAYPKSIDENTAEGAQLEIDQVIDILFEHRDTDSKNTIARRTARRLLEYFVHGGFANPTAALITVIDDVLTRSGFGTAGNWNTGDLVREILLDDEFYASLGDDAKKSIKWPVDYFVGTIRVLGLKLLGHGAGPAGQFFDGAFVHLSNMGQTLLDPPSVFGWDWEASWISSQTLLGRYRFVVDVISARGPGGLVPQNLIDLGLTDPAAIVDAVTELLGVKDDLSGSERTALVTYMGPGPLDLNDYHTRNRKLHGLIGLVLESPAYQLH